MEKSVLEVEIDQLAKNPARIPPIDNPSQVDLYIGRLTTMKM